MLATDHVSLLRSRAFSAFIKKGEKPFTLRMVNFKGQEGI